MQRLVAGGGEREEVGRETAGRWEPWGGDPGPLPLLHDTGHMTSRYGHTIVT